MWVMVSNVKLLLENQEGILCSCSQVLCFFSCSAEPALRNESIAKGQMLLFFFSHHGSSVFVRAELLRLRISGEGMGSSNNRIPVPSAGRKYMGLGWTSPLKSVFCLRQFSAFLINYSCQSETLC